MSDNNLDDLLGQLKSNNKAAKELNKQQKCELINPADKEDLEQYIIEKSTILINQTVGALQNIQQQILAAPDPENISSYSELVKASTNAIDNLNKIVLQNKKTDTSRELKQMDIQSKAISDDKKLIGQAIATREQVLDKLMSDADVIELPVDGDDNLDS